MLIRNFNGKSLYSVVATSKNEYFSTISKSELPFVPRCYIKMPSDLAGIGVILKVFY